MNWIVSSARLRSGDVVEHEHESDQMFLRAPDAGDARLDHPGLAVDQPVEAEGVLGLLLDDLDGPVETDKINVFAEVVFPEVLPDDACRAVSEDALGRRVVVDDLQVQIRGHDAEVHGRAQDVVDVGALLVQIPHRIPERGVLFADDLPEGVDVLALQPADDVGLGNQSGDVSAFVHDDHPADAVLAHERRGLEDRGVLGNGKDRSAHDLLHAPAEDVLPAFDPLRRVPLGDDPDRLLLPGDDQAADRAVDHQRQGVVDGTLRVHRGNGPGHDLGDELDVDEIFRPQEVDDVGQRDHANRQELVIDHHQVADLVGHKDAV
jgi:hypothetical protein